MWVLSRSIWRGIIPAERRGSLAYNHGKWAMDRDPRGQHFSWPLACGRQTSGEERLLLARMVGMDIIRTHYTRRWKKDQERKSNKQFQPPEIFLKYCNLMDKIKGGSPYWHTENILIKKKKDDIGLCVCTCRCSVCYVCVVTVHAHVCVHCRMQRSILDVFFQLLFFFFETVIAWTISQPCHLIIELQSFPTHPGCKSKSLCSSYFNKTQRKGRRRQWTSDSSQSWVGVHNQGLVGIISPESSLLG